MEAEDETDTQRARRGDRQLEAETDTRKNKTKRQPKAETDTETARHRDMQLEAVTDTKKYRQQDIGIGGYRLRQTECENRDRQLEAETERARPRELRR